MMARIKYHYSSWIFKLPWMKGYAGQCLGRHIHFRDSKEQTPVVLVWHELIHQKQMDRHGVWGFYFKYFRDYFKNFLFVKKWRFCHDLAYRNIPFEVEAYENQGKGNPYESAT